MRWRLVPVVVVLGLAGCGKSAPRAAPTTVAAAPRPTLKGFGGTIPVTTSTAVATTPPASTSPPPTNPFAAEEAALRARVADYNRVVREESLRLPKADIEKVRAFFVPAVARADSVGFLLDSQKSGQTVAVNSPDIDTARIEQVAFSTASTARVSLCTEDNIIIRGPGADGVPGTSDDNVIDDSLGSNRFVVDWISERGVWRIARVVESIDLGEGQRCGNS